MKNYLLHRLLSFVCLMLSLTISSATWAQTTLTPGDVVVVGYNTTNPDALRLLLLTNITAGTSFSITDNGWLKTGGFRTGEGILGFTAPANLAAGTVLTWENGSSTNTAGFSSNNPPNFSLNSTGESVIIYTGSFISPTPVYALSSGAWNADATSASTSAEPIAANNGPLTSGVTTIALTTNGANGYYSGTRTSGNKAQLLAAISSAANWTTSASITSTALWPSNFTVNQPDLTVSVAGPASATAGQPYTYTLIVANGGTAVASSIPVSYSLPTGLTYNSASGTNGFTVASQSGGFITFTGGTITAGNSAAITVSVTPTAPGSITIMPAAAVVDGSNTIAESNETNNTSTQTVVTSVVAPCPTITATLNGTTTICAGNSTTLSASITGGTSPYTVRVSDGTNTSTVTGYTSGSAISITPATSKTYTIVSVTDANACPATVTGTGAAVTVAPNPVAAITNLTNTYCKNAAPVTLTGTPTGAGFTGAFTIDGATATIFDPASLTVGNHMVVYSVTTTSGCTGSDSKSVTVKPVPNPNITGLANTYCKNEAPVTLTGTPTGGDFTIDGIAATVFDPASLSIGQHTVVYSFTNAVGCSASDSKSVGVRRVPTPVIAGNLTVCAGSSTTLTASGGDTYLWSTNVASTSIVVPAGTYSVTATNNPSGCFSSTSVTVTDVASPTATLTGTATVCSGSSANLTATITGGTGSYSLTYSDGTSTTSISNYTSGAPIAVSPGVSTTYTIVSVTGANGCAATSSGTAVVTVNPQPSVSSAGTSQNITPGSTATLAANAPSVGTGIWSVASGPSTLASQFSSTTTPTASFTPAGGLGTYVLTWTISNAPCTPSTSNVTITVAQPTCGTLTVPGNYTTIQAAIDAACPGALIQVAAGTYTEQLTISKSLSIVGAGLGSTKIKAPTMLAVGGPDEGAPYVKRNIVEIKGSSSVTLAGLTVDGPITGQDGCGTDAFDVYVYDNSSLALSNAAITNAQLSDPSLFGCQVGFALGVGLTGSPGSATLTNVTMSNYQKGGILARGTGTVLVADNITVTGIGATTATAQNGVQVSSGASATITNSSITNNAYIAVGNAYTASGIITYNSGPVTISGSAFMGNDVGLDAEGTGVTNITNNSFTGNGYASVYTDQVMTLNSSGNTFDKQVTNSNKTGTIYSAIQAAVNDALANDVLTAGAGTFAENIIIDKTLTINGANAGTNPNSGSRVAETIIVPATTGADYDNGGTNIIITVNDGVNNVVLDGLTIDGNNPNLTAQPKNVVVNGVDIDAATGISMYGSGQGGLTVRNNIIKNIAIDGVEIGSSSAPSNNTIQYNKFDNIAYQATSTGSGQAIYAGDNAYATVTDNVMTRVLVGVQTGNHYSAAPGGTPTIANNTISAYRIGIYHNLQYNNATGFVIQNNTISADGSLSGVTPNAGLRLYAILGNVSAIATGNIINSGFQYGIYDWNTPSTGDVRVSGGSVQGSVAGIRAINSNNFGDGDAKLTVSGVTITNSPVGVLVVDDPAANPAKVSSVTVTGNTQISTSATAVAISGSDASASITGNASSFVGTGSGTGVDVNGGTASVTANRVVNFATGISVSNGGQLTSAANNFITGNATGVAYTADASATQGMVTNNDLSGNTGKAITNGIASTTIGATCNWYGTTNVDGQAATLFTGAVTYSPYLNTGTDSDGNSNTGFQPVSGACVRNLPPTASVVASQTATVNQAFSFTVPAFTDPENQTLTYTASIVPPNGLSFNSTTRVISGTPTVVGMSSVTVTATDPASMSASQTFTITVTAPTCGTLNVPGDYSTIQAAIDAACPGAVIRVAANTYTEQLLISKNLSIVGAGLGNTIVQAPGTLTAGTLDPVHRNIVEINNGAVVTITGINVNGPVATSNGCGDSVYGININGGAGLNLSNASVTNVYLTPTTLGGCQSGIGIRAGFNALGSPGSLTTTNVTVSGYQKAGIVIDGTGSDGQIMTTTVTGAGATTVIAQNGIQISRGATGNVLNATITGNSYTDINNTDTQAAGLLAYNSGTITATGNTISGNNAGIYAFADAGTPGVLTANNNTFSNNDYASTYAETPATITGSGNTYDKQVTDNNRPGTVYSTIQLAVDKATAGDVISAAAGTYPEAVSVTKSLTINGAQTGVDPRAGRSGGESIVTAPGDITADGNLFTVRANNVVIDGFTLDGDNPAVSGGTSTNGADINARRGISNGHNGSFDYALNGLTVQNNIIKNLLRSGVFLYLENQAADVSMSNVLARQNVFTNVGNFGVYAENNAYVSVVSNTITQTRNGIGIFSNGTQYTGTGTPQVTGNDITSEVSGLYYNNMFGAGGANVATPYSVSNNTFRSVGTGNVGMRLYSLFIGGHTFTNNTATGTDFGALVWNTPGIGAPTISGGSLEGKTAAVRLTNNEIYDGPYGNGTTAATISGVSITNSPIGVQAFDDPAATSGTSSVTVTGNTQITGSGAFTAVAISGPDASASITGNASSFVGSGSGVGVDINGGSAGVTANRITNFATGINVSNGGQLTGAANNFITGNNTGISYAGDAGTTQGIVTINDLSGNTNKALVNGLTSTTINANCNYFGSPSATTNPTYVSGNVSTTQVLANNTDEAPGTPGFQNTSCFVPPTGAPVLTISPAPQFGPNTSYCIGENPTVTSNYTTGTNSFTVQARSDGSTTVTTGNSVTITQGAGAYDVFATNSQNGYTSPVSATFVQIEPVVTNFVSAKAAYCVGETVSLTALGCNVTASSPNLYKTLLRSLDGSNNENQGTAFLPDGVTSYTYTQFAVTTPTMYTVTAECVNVGTGQVCGRTQLVIMANPLPVAFSVTGGGAYCAGGPGVPVGLSGSETGVSYQLYDGASTVGTPVAGTGNALSFSTVTAAGTYSVVATNTATSCQTAMTGSATVSIIPTAAAPVLTASPPANPQQGSYNATYCIGENPTVTTDYTTGVNSFTVQALSGGSLTVTTGNSVTISQGAGTYFVYSTNAQANGCTSPVSATTTIQVQPVVTSFTADKAAYCVGETVSLTALGCNVATASQPNLYFVRLRALDGSGNENQGTAGLGAGVTSFTYTQFATSTTKSYTITAECVNGGTGNVCAKTELAITAYPLPVATLVSSGTITCNQPTVTLTATGGQSYTFTGPGVVSSDPIAGTAVVDKGGSYSVSVTSATGCSSMTIVRVYRDASKPTATLTASGSGTLTCNQTSLTLTASATGGSPGYTYAFSADATPISTSAATVTTAGLYSVTATGANGCFDVATVRVYRDASKPTATLTASGSGTLTCNQTSLTLTASATGGSPGYTYLFSTDATPISTTEATVTTAGLYSVTATGANGCFDVATVRVYRDAGKPTATLTASGSGTLTCNQTSLTLTASATGGSPGYTYAFSADATPISTTAATVTTAGLYSVTATGTNGCFDVATVRVYRDAGKPTASLTASGSGTLTCNQTSLTLTASATGGSPAYTYAFSADATPISTTEATVTTAGLYSVTATGANGCFDVATVRVYRDAGKPTASLTASGSGTLTCNQTSLTLTASATGGSPAYTYLFSADATPISTTAATVTTAGLYSVTATGTNGCFDVATVRVYRDAGKPTASLTASGSGTLTCNQTSLTLTASATGGSPAYTYLFSADATPISTTAATVTTAGLYSVTATGTNGCFDVATVRVYRDAGKPTASLTASGSGTLTCNQTSLTLTASATGGSPGYTYAFSADATPISTSAATVTTAGLYSVTATGANGCFDVATVRVYRDASKPTATLTASGSGTLTCNQTSLTLTASATGGSPGYTYLFSTDATPISTTEATVTTAGLYSVTATGANGCFDVATVRVYRDAGKPTATLTASNSGTLTCNQTSLTLTASATGGSPGYTYAFSTDATPISTSAATVTTAGLYSVTATGANGCFDVATVRVYRDAGKPTATLTASGSGTLTCNQTSLTLTASATGGSPAYTYLFSADATPISTTAATVTTAGLYSVTATGTNGCFDVATVRVYRDAGKPTASLTASGSGTLTCNQTSLTLTASATGGSPGYTYAFSADATPISTSAATVTTAGLYSVTATGANGCFDVATVRVYRDASKPTATLTASGSGTLTCNQTSLTLTASATGGSPGYTYLFSTDATPISTTEATVTTAGLYSVTATGANGCFDVATVRVYRDAGKPTATLTASGSGTLTCNQTSLTLTASATGGSPGYTYAFSADATPISTTAATVTTAGLYSVTATGTNGCFDVATVRVYRDAGKPTASLTASGSGTLTCNQTSLTLTASATGGSPAYTYLFSADATPISTTAATVTTAGLYSVTATGTNGCFDVATVRVYRDAGKPTASLTASGSGTLTCNQTSLTLTASATGGSPAYTYLFSADATPISTTAATVTTAGLYSVTATGTNGCFDVATVRVYRDAGKPTATLTASGSGTLTCNQTSLTLTASATGGSPGYTYAFSTDATPISTSAATVTTAGLYSVTATGANGCFDVATVRVYRDAGKPTATLTASNSGTLTCNQTSLTLTASATGGSPGYTYAFSTDATPISTSAATVTTAGLYSVTATGANGCFDVATVRVYRDAGKPTATLTASNSGTLTCNQTSLTLTASATGGSPGYTYAFSTDATPISTSAATVTTAGLYSVTATGANGCFDVATVRVYRDAGKPTATLTASGSGTLTCNQTSLTLTASATGGSPGYTYAFSTDATPISTSAATVTTAGLYSVTATGANGCFDVATVRVYRDAGKPTATLTASNSGTLTCNQTSLTLTASATGGSPGYTYAFSTDATPISTSAATVTTAGLYSVTATGANGCFDVATVRVYRDAGKPTATLTASGSGTLTCNQTSLTLTASATGGSPAYTYLFSADATPISTTEATVTTAGLYSVTATGANGCFDVATVRVYRDAGKPTATLTASNSGTLTCNQTSLTLTASATGGSPGYTYLFSTDATPISTSAATVTTAGLYSVTATGANGCFDVATVTVSSSTSVVTPDFATRGNQAIADGLTSVTVVQNTTPVMFNATNCSGTLNWNGNGQMGTTTLNAPTSATGVFVYQATCTVGSCVSSPASVTVTITPANTAPAPTANANQTATVGQQFTYTVNAFTDDTPNSLTYTASIDPANGFTFNAATRMIQGTPQNTGTSSVTIIATDPGGLSASTKFTITVLPVPVVTNLTVLSRDPENGNLNTNTIKPYLLLQNDGTTAIPYGELTVRYYLTVENPVPLRFDINYAQMGNNNVHLNYVPLNPARQGASGYIEFSFDAAAGSLAPNSNAVIQDLVNKQDYSMFFQGDDYSYVNNPNFAANPHITAYRNGVLVYGVEPLPTGPPAPLTLTLTANPTMVLTTGNTTLTASASGGTPGYTYAFSGPGTITPSGNTASVSNLPAGVQTFSVMVTDNTAPVAQTASATVSVTVTAPANQTPVATANANQTATQGVQFSYTANAFTDDTPNSLTYTASINPANGFTFNPATRVIQGLPLNTGVSSVTITATDPGGLSASTVFTITVNPVPVAPTALTLTASASPTTILTTGSTQLQASVSGGTPGYTYTFSGPGTIQASGNTATVSNLPEGVQIFTVTARDATSPVNQTITTTVSVTVNAAPNQAPVATANANQTATQGVQFSYTANAFTDDTPNSLTYIASIDPANGFTFNAATRMIQGTPQNTGLSSVTITATDPGGLSASTTFTINVLPAPVVTDRLTVYSRDPDNGQLNTNTLKPYLQLQNDGNTPIPYGELTVRYWLTVENPAPFRFEINYAQLGSDKVHLNYVMLPTPRQGASGYIEFSFDASAGSLAANSNSGPIQDLINKQDYSYFNQGDDYSYVNTGNFTPNARITAYRNGVLIYGTEPPSTVRIAAENADALLRVEVLGNPLAGGELAVKVTGANGQPLRLRVTDLNGHLVTERTVERAGAVEEQRLSVSQQAAGLLFLQVSTPGQTQTVKVLKAN